MKSTLDDLKARRSYRAFKPEQVKKEDLDAILEAGTFAASGGGQQAAIMVAVQNKEVVAQLEALNAEVLKNPAAKPFYGAPTVIAVLADKTKATPLEDGALVIGNLLLASYAIGVGSCWIHRAKEVFESAQGKALLEKWGVKGDYVGIGFCILGYPAGDKPQAKPRKDNYIYRD